MASTGTERSQPVVSALAETLGSERSRPGARALARELLAVDRPPRTHLVGVDYRRTTAIYYHCEQRYAIAVRFDIDGLADGGPVIAEFDDQPDLDRWIDSMGAYWGWRHPRYR